MCQSIPGYQVLQRLSLLFAIWLVSVNLHAQDNVNSTPAAGFPRELTDWVPFSRNPVFAGTGRDTWDRKIRERGFILRDNTTWHLWYTGYDDAGDKLRRLGHAVSADGIRWVRDSENPVFEQTWTEDVFVLKHGTDYQMFAEGLHDIAHRLTSPDGVHWRDHGPLDIRQANGKPISPGPYGTPTVWIAGDTWYLFYERGDRGVWLATSTDLGTWTNLQDEPVLTCGPNAYDRHAIALNQIVQVGARYFGIYHANDDPNWNGPWTTCLAASDDLVHWGKYPGNPIIRSNDSSGVLVPDGSCFRLYTMHPNVKLWLPRDVAEQRGSTDNERPGS